MLGRVAGVFRRHPFLATGFALASLLTLLFAARSVMFMIYWADPRHQDQAIAGWMTPRYVAVSWQVPPEVVGDALGVARPAPGERRTLDEIAEQEGIPLAELARRLEAAIAAHRGTGQ